MFNEYKVTGIYPNGRRFSPIRTNSYGYAMGINLWRGSVWKRTDQGKWNKIKDVFN
jgi:hypothetical protein